MAIASSAVLVAVDEWLAEDVGAGDLTTERVVPEGMICEARLLLKERGVVCGLEVAEAVFRALDDEVVFEAHAADGDDVEAPAEVARLAGSARAILTGERTALNLLCHLSGIATATRRYVTATSGKARIRDTRKTTPGLRALEKAAVRAGGGVNHRGSLSDFVLVKDNHLGGLTIVEAVRRAKMRWPGRTIEVECDTLDQVREAVAAGVELVLLDNFDLADTRTAVELVRGTGVRLEASGGLSLDRAAEVAATGVDYLAVGALTHSAPVLDLGFDLREA